jgi:hypothetical protein
MMDDELEFHATMVNWSAYQMQFELISEHNNWTASVKAIELLTELKDDAMVYSSFLPSDVKSSFSSLGAAMASRFGDHGYPETYKTRTSYTEEVIKRDDPRVCIQSRDVSTKIFSNHRYSYTWYTQRGVYAQGTS